MKWKTPTAAEEQVRRSTWRRAFALAPKKCIATGCPYNFWFRTGYRRHPYHPYNDLPRRFRNEDWVWACSKECAIAQDQNYGLNSRFAEAMTDLEATVGHHVSKHDHIEKE